jgi:hypothetical protein
VERRHRKAPSSESLRESGESLRESDERKRLGRSASVSVVPELRFHRATGRPYASECRDLSGAAAIRAGASFILRLADRFEEIYFLKCISDSIQNTGGDLGESSFCHFQQHHVAESTLQVQ